MHILIKKLFGLSMLSCIFLLSGCAERESPKINAEKFCKAMQADDLEEASKYTTEHTRSMLEKLVDIPPEDRRIPKNCTPTRETITRDAAEVFFKGENGQEESINLIFVDNRWQVASKK